MIRIARFATPVVAFGLLLGLLHARATAEDAKKETGSISGKVVDQDGKAVASAQVRVMLPMDKRDKAQTPEKKEGEAKKTEQQAALGVGYVELAKGDKSARPTPIASGSSDADGKFTINDVPVGKYVLMANVKGVGGGRENVEVKKGETTDVTVTIKPKEAKKQQ